MTKKQTSRIAQLAFGRIPKYIRCYDTGHDGPIDRYTVVFTGRIRARCGGSSPYLAMNGSPFDPQGFGQRGETPYACDNYKGHWPPAIGRKCHLGTRIEFTQLPIDCQKLVWQDYSEIWNIPNPFEKTPVSVSVKG